MRLNQDFAMAVETVCYLEKRPNSDFVQSKEVARKLGFSVGYLQKVVQNLSKHGIIECKRGRIGGIRLRPRNVTLLDLWEATCGRLEISSPSPVQLKKPLRVFRDAMRQVIISKRGR